MKSTSQRSTMLHDHSPSIPTSNHPKIATLGPQNRVSNVLAEMGIWVLFWHFKAGLAILLRERGRFPANAEKQLTSSAPRTPRERGSQQAKAPRTRPTYRERGALVAQAT